MNQKSVFQACCQISFPSPSVLFQTRFSKALTVCNIEKQVYTLLHFLQISKNPYCSLFVHFKKKKKSYKEKKERERQHSKDDFCLIFFFFKSKVQVCQVQCHKVISFCFDTPFTCYKIKANKKGIGICLMFPFKKGVQAFVQKYKSYVQAYLQVVCESGCGVTPGSVCVCMNLCGSIRQEFRFGLY